MVAGSLVRSYGVSLALTYVPTEANIPILEAGRISKIPMGPIDPPPCMFQVAILGAHFSLVDECLYSVFLPEIFCQKIFQRPVVFSCSDT